MNETIEKLQKFIIVELTHVRGKQWTKDTENDVFHFYSGMATALQNVLDQLCTLEGIRKEEERKEVK